MGLLSSYLPCSSEYRRVNAQSAGGEAANDTQLDGDAPPSSADLFLSQPPPSYSEAMSDPAKVQYSHIRNASNT